MSDSPILSASIARGNDCINHKNALSQKNLEQSWSYNPMGSFFYIMGHIPGAPLLTWIGFNPNMDK